MKKQMFALVICMAFMVLGVAAMEDKNTFQLHKGSPLRDTETGNRIIERKEKKRTGNDRTKKGGVKTECSKAVKHYK